MPAAKSVSFDCFYRDVFLAEHTHWANVALHIAGTLAGLAWLAWTLTQLPGLWKLLGLLFPVVHAAPGLLGHRLFERSLAVGDARWQRTDFPIIWFIAGNHLLTWQTLTGRRPSVTSSISRADR